MLDFECVLYTNSVVCHIYFRALKRPLSSADGISYVYSNRYLCLVILVQGMWHLYIQQSHHQIHQVILSFDLWILMCSLCVLCFRNAFAKTLCWAIIGAFRFVCFGFFVRYADYIIAYINIFRGAIAGTCWYAASFIVDVITVRWSDVSY